MRSAEGSTTREIEIPPFRFWETRSGEGTPVVLIHGLAGSSGWWRHNVPALAKQHLVVAIDLVGFGRSGGWRRGSASLPLPFDDTVRMLARWIEISFAGPVHLVGHSMGGQVSIHLAALRPDLVRSLSLLASTGIPFEVDPIRHLASVSFPRRNVLSFLPVLARDFFRAGPASVVIAWGRLVTNDARDALRRIRAPSLLLWGEADPLVPLRYGEEMLRHLPTADLVVVPDSGHVVMWDNPEEVNRILLEFLGDLDHGLVAAPRVPHPFVWPIEGSAAGLAWRQSGPEPSVVLIHGLGISSHYFRPMVDALKKRGWAAIAPDLPGTGYSRDVRIDPGRHAERVLAWYRTVGGAPAIWIGHSDGTQIVERIATLAPGLVRGRIHLSPIWNERRHPWIELFFAALADIPRERVGLVLEAVQSYWATGIPELIRLALAYVPDAKRLPSLDERSLVVAGEDDPLVDWQTLGRIAAGRLVRLPGAHAIIDSQPEALADVLVPWLQRWSQ
ncbi:MAG: alpha/beta fold hydrolase [Thermoanaerobaculia bacterium]